MEDHVHDFEKRLQDNERDIRLMSDRLQQEYNDFCNARKRWKSDFQNADEKNRDHI